MEYFYFENYYRERKNFMRLWTVQPYGVFQEMQKKGVYRCNHKKSEFIQEWDGFASAYDWISKQMRKRIGNPPKGVEYPVWAWYLHEGKNKRPDMRRSDVRVNEKSVLWEVEIPDNEVLLTDEEYWHCVLNDYLYHKANKENISIEQWEIEANKEDKYYDSLSPKEKTQYKEKSWENIICSPNCNSSYVQATFWELKASQIRKAWILKK